MNKYTHLTFALLTFLLFNYILNFPIYLSIFAFIGSLIPDIDLYPKKFHRKLAHNIWFLLFILYLGFNFNLIDRTIAIVLSIGFLSHLIADSLTHKGIMPLWPIKKPKFNGPIKVGGFSEFLLMCLLLFIIFSIGKLI